MLNSPLQSDSAPSSLPLGGLESCEQVWMCIPLQLLREKEVFVQSSRISFNFPSFYNTSIMEQKASAILLPGKQGANNMFRVIMQWLGQNSNIQSQGHRSQTMTNAPSQIDKMPHNLQNDKSAMIISHAQNDISDMLEFVGIVLYRNTTTLLSSDLFSAIAECRYCGRQRMPSILHSTSLNKKNSHQHEVHNVKSLAISTYIKQPAVFRKYLCM